MEESVSNKTSIEFVDILGIFRNYVVFIVIIIVFSLLISIHFALQQSTIYKSSITVEITPFEHNNAQQESSFQNDVARWELILKDKKTFENAIISTGNSIIDSQNTLMIRPIEDSSVYIITFSSNDENLSRKMLRALIDTTNEKYQIITESRFLNEKQKCEFIVNRIEDRLDLLFQELSNYPKTIDVYNRTAKEENTNLIDGYHSILTIINQADSMAHFQKAITENDYNNYNLIKEIFQDYSTNRFPIVFEKGYFKLLAQIIIELTNLSKARSKIHNLDSSMALENSQILIIDDITIQQETQNSLLVVLVGLILGSGLSLILSLLLDSFSRTVNDKQIIYRIIGRSTPSIFSIPKGMHRQILFSEKDKKLRDAYMQLSGILLNSQFFPEDKVYVISSLSESEKKSETVFNICLSLLSSGKRIRLIGFPHDKSVYIDLIHQFESRVSPLLKIDHYDTISDSPEVINMSVSTFQIVIADQQIFTNKVDSKNGMFLSTLTSNSGPFDLVIIDAPSYENPSLVLAIAKQFDGLILNIHRKVGSRKHLSSLVQALDICDIQLKAIIISNQFSKIIRYKWFFKYILRK